MSKSSSLVAAHGICKSFGSIRAVDNISFEVKPQQIFSLLGPNGAGKSTLVRMLIGMLPPDRGKFLWQDGNENVAMNRAKIGYLPEDRGLYKDQPVAATLEYFAQLHGLSRSDTRRVVQNWIERLELCRYAKSKLETLSKGNQQKVQIASALLHRPELVVLDEPFSGLDPINQELMVNLVREIRSDGATVLLSAHQLHLIERLADHVMIVAKGREVLSGTVAEICQGPLGGKTLRVEYEHPIDKALLPEIRRDVEIQGIQLEQPNLVVVNLDAHQNQLGCLNKLHEWGPVRTFQSRTISLHEIYLRVASDTEQGPTLGETE
ncbi:MAG: ATP-binding cassette domain-containing protein [Planctomycetaceae bacterium]|nr:ATP-binding cassette domain-containing protein [Planctomycetaceae bacterium]